MFTVLYARLHPYMSLIDLCTSTDIYAVYMYTYFRAHIPIYDNLYLYMFAYYFVHIPPIKFYILLYPRTSKPS